MAALKLTAVGTSTGVVIPKEMLNRMKVSRGDRLHVTETPDGYLLTPYDPAIAAQVALADFHAEVVNRHFIRGKIAFQRHVG